MTPVLSVVKGKNGALIAAAARLWIKPDDFVLDLTYGKGNFWTEVRPSRLYTNDLSAAVHADYPYDFRDLSALSDSLGAMWDVVVFDPPYISTGNKETSTLRGKDLYERYGIGGEGRKGWKSVKADIQGGISEAIRIVRPGGILMVKVCDYVESGKRRWGHQWAIEAATAECMTEVDEFIHHSGTGPQPLTNVDGSPRVFRHSRRAHSFLCVFQKGK